MNAIGNKVKRSINLKREVKIGWGLKVICGISLLYAAVNARDVLIDFTIPLLLGAICGLIGVFFTKNKDDYLFTFLGFGALVIGIPMLINKTFADFRNEEIKLIIKDRHHAAGRHRASVDISYNGFEKAILLDDNADLDGASHIILKVNKGLFGYYIIRDTQLVKE